MISISSRLRPFVSGMSLRRGEMSRSKGTIARAKDVQSKKTHSSYVNGAEHKEDLVLQSRLDLKRDLRNNKVYSENETSAWRIRGKVQGNALQSH